MMELDLHQRKHPESVFRKLGSTKDRLLPKSLAAPRRSTLWQAPNQMTLEDRWEADIHCLAPSQVRRAFGTNHWKNLGSMLVYAIRTKTHRRPSKQPAVWSGLEATKFPNIAERMDMYEVYSWSTHGQR